jgi:CubicO group peptidase (beta-lactamase class C family)
MLVEQVTGASTATVLSRDVFQPLGPDRLAYQDEQALPPPLATASSQDELPVSASSATYLPYRSWASAPGGAGVIAGDAPSVASLGVRPVRRPAAAAGLRETDWTTRRVTNGPQIGSGDALTLRLLERASALAPRLASVGGCLHLSSFRALVGRRGSGVG